MASIKALIEWILNGSEKERGMAYNALWRAASINNINNKLIIAKEGEMKPLIETLWNGSNTQKELAADVLRIIAALSGDFQVMIKKEGGIKPLVELLSNESMGVK